jgi:glucose-6-phosphate isomerase
MLKFTALKLENQNASASRKNEVRSALNNLLSRKDLGFFQLPDRDKNWDDSLKFSDQLKARGTHLIVIGFGGSALGGRCLIESLTDACNAHASSVEGGKVDAALANNTVEFLLNTDPLAVERVFSNSKKIQHSQFLIISKSGNTLEIACLLDLLIQRLKSENREIKDAVSVITEDTENPLHLWAVQNKVLILPHPKDVGGRFSVFTPVGLVPAAFAGVDLRGLRAGAKAALSSAYAATKLAPSTSDLEAKNFVCDISAFYLESFVRKESISVFWSYIEQFNSFSSWLVQLWAESLAKQDSLIEASTPVSYFGTCDQHSVLQQLMEGAKDKSICFIRSSKLQLQGECFSGQGLKGFEYLKSKILGEVFQTQSQSTELALREAGRTTTSIDIDELNELALGELLMSFQLIIGVLGECLKINAFNQPGVELGKKITKEKLTKSSSH